MNQETSTDELQTYDRENHLFFAFDDFLTMSSIPHGPGCRPRLLRTALATDVALAFDRRSIARNDGELSLVDMPGATVDGGLFAIDDWAGLDSAYAVPQGHRQRIALPVLVPDSSAGTCREAIAQTYLTTTPEGFVRPGAESLRRCRQARETLGLRTVDLEHAAAGEPNGFGGDRLGIFTYGTLCRGESRSRVMRTGPLDHVTIAEVRGMSLRRHTSGAFPCLTEAGSAEGEPRPVAGDLWTYRSDTLNAVALSKLFPRLDVIESHFPPKIHQLVRIARERRGQGFSVDEAAAGTREFVEELYALSKFDRFRRTLVPVHVRGRSTLAWTYLYVGPSVGLLPITSGNWRKYAGRWDTFLQSLAASYLDQAGGLDGLCAAAEKASLRHITDVRDVADLAHRLDTGQVREHELIDLVAAGDRP